MKGRRVRKGEGREKEGGEVGRERREWWVRGVEREVEWERGKNK